MLVVTRGAARLAAAAAAARNCNYSSSLRSSRTARRGPALAWRNHQVVAAAVAGNSNKELVVVEVAVYCVVVYCTVLCSVVVVRCV